MNPKVSIIMPSYNSEKFISESIKSVIDQTFYDWELIVVDDCSTDNSPLIVKQLAKDDKRIKLFCLNKNEGHPSVVRNIALQRAEGEFIAFLDSDDVWLPEKLELQLKFMREKQIAFAYSAYECITEDGKQIKREVIPPPSLSYTDLLKHCRIGCLTAIYNSSKLGKLYFVPNAGQEDYIYWLEILKKSKMAYGIPTVLGQYRVRKSSVSSNKLKLIKHNWKVYYSFQNLGFFKSCFYFTNNIYYWLSARI